MAINSENRDSSVLSGLGAGRKYVIAPDAPVLPTLASQCECEIVVKDDGATLVLFTKEPPGDTEWAEYDSDLMMLTFVTWSGKVMGLGMKIHKTLEPQLKLANTIVMAHMVGGTALGAMYPIKLMHRHVGF